MKYQNITEATFLSRPNRFVAEVKLDNKKEIVHVKNTGRCEPLVPGAKVWLTEPNTPNRKTKYDLIAVETDIGTINLDSQAPNKVVKEWLAKQDFTTIKTEYRYGDSRIDFYMEKEQERYLIEVKGCTMHIGQVGYFPDAPTQRGTKHINELIKAKQQGYIPILAFVIQMPNIEEVLPNEQTDRQFAQAFHQAKQQGVRILNLTCDIKPDELTITAESQFKNTKNSNII
ncbi:MAG: DNA/RNA nuclease SfsA [Clostridiales bacterium]|nr:DNA/RNA nuclease SfsA [Clostridiales bacterium]